MKFSRQLLVWGQRTLLEFSLLSALASMGPCFALPLAALACFLLPAGCCVMCDNRILAALKSLETDYLPKLMGPAEVNSTYAMIVRTVKGFSDLPYTKQTYMGAIGEKRYEMVITSFLKNLKNITESKTKGKQSVENLKEMLRLEKINFAFQASMFQKEDYCPNKCGAMFQSLIWCDYCSKQVQLCKKKTEECGDRVEEIHEHEALNLNCFLDWHKEAVGLTNYVFYRVWENNSETVLYSGKDPVFNRPSASVNDSGKYRCELGTIYNRPSTIIHFLVTVLPRDLEGWKPTGEFAPAKTEGGKITSVTPSPEPETTTVKHQEVKSMLKGRIYGLLICLLIILIAAIIFWLVTRKRKKTKPKSSQASIDSKSSRISRKASSKMQKK
nr:izumo sperm-egg fusion protein 1-like [Ictidomys tridecemlineatus]